MTKNKYAQKKIINEAIEKDFQERMTSARTKKSKINHLMTGRLSQEIDERQNYMNKLNRYQTSIIFKARTRMIDVKNNFRGKYPNNTCRGCGQTDETQEHVLEECPGIHNNEEMKTDTHKIFTDDMQILIKSSENIIRIVQKLSQSGLHGAHV